MSPVHAKRRAHHNGSRKLILPSLLDTTIRSAFAADRAGASFRRGRFAVCEAGSAVLRDSPAAYRRLSGLRLERIPKRLNMRELSNITCSCGSSRSSRKRAWSGRPKFWQILATWLLIYHCDVNSSSRHQHLHTVTIKADDGAGRKSAKALPFFPSCSKIIWSHER